MRQSYDERFDIDMNNERRENMVSGSVEFTKHLLQDNTVEDTVTTVRLNNSKQSKRKTGLDFHQSGADEMNTNVSKHNKKVGPSTNDSKNTTPIRAKSDLKEENIPITTQSQLLNYPKFSDMSLDKDKLPQTTKNNKFEMP